MTAGLVLGVGLLLISEAWRARRPSLMSRVAPYVGGVIAHKPGAAAIGGRVLRAGAARLDEILGGPASVRRRLERCGSGLSPDGFRVRQVAAAGIGLAGAAAVSLLIWARVHTAPFPLLVLCGVGFVAGVIAADLALTSQVRRREQRLTEEFPVVAELLALAVAAGESPVRGLERVLAVTGGATADELGRVLGDIRTGTAAAAAFDALAARTGVVAMSRFAKGLAVALERGTPLVDVLHAQAADVREAARRDLIESAGRREVAMMIPVVFGIMPTTIVFAFFPGLVGLQLASGG
jgi:tight adherence protein C